MRVTLVFFALLPLFSCDVIRDVVVPEEAPSFHIGCGICKMGVNLVLQYVKNGKPEAEIINLIVNLCIQLNGAEPSVCRGAVKAFVPGILYVIKHTPLLAADACGFIVGGKCEDKNYESKFNWTVPAPTRPKPPVQPLTPPQAGRPTKRILHISDTHLDLYYQEGSKADCDLPLCCRQSLGMPTDPKQQAGKWGDYRHCDTPLRMLENMYEHIAKNDKVDLILWTGDIPTHDVWNLSQAENLRAIKKSVDLLLQYFPDTPIFPAVGNHEGEPVNTFPLPDITGEFSVSWLTDELSKSWPKLVKEDVSETVSKGAFYSVLVEPHLRIISVNMNYGNYLNWWLLINPKQDPVGQLEWLTQELTKAELNKEKVYIIGHIAPGDDDCAKVWSRNFHKIISRFESTVVAQFYGHTHYDELLLFYDDDDLKRATNVAYIGASTTAYSFNNPAYKVFTADGDYPGSTRMIMDGDTYYMDLEAANMDDNPKWTLLYSYKEAYGLDSLTPAEWDRFVRKLPNDQQLFDKFYKHLHRDSDVFPECDTACANELICKQVVAKSRDYSVCEQMGLSWPPPSSSIFRRPRVLGNLL